MSCDYITASSAHHDAMLRVALVVRYPASVPKLTAVAVCGVLQVVFEPQTQPEASKLGARLRSEWVVCVKGQLRLRKDPNPKMPTGEQQQLQHKTGVAAAAAAAAAIHLLWQAHGQPEVKSNGAFELGLQCCCCSSIFH
jgi:hypothetical protein